MSSILKALPALLLSLFVLPFTSCETAGKLVSGGLGDTLGSVASFSRTVGEWSGGIGEAVDGTVLSQLGDYAKQANGLAKSLDGMTAAADEALKDPLGSLTAKLKEMGGLDVGELENAGEEEKKKAVAGFSKSAEEAGAIADDISKQIEAAAETEG